MRSMGDAIHGCGLTLCWDRLGQFRRYPMGRRLAAVDHAGVRSVTSGMRSIRSREERVVVKLGARRAPSLTQRATVTSMRDAVHG
jgi:hypothetical protein